MIEKLLRVAYEYKFENGLRGIKEESTANYCGRVAALYARAPYMTDDDFVIRFKYLKAEMIRFVASNSSKKKAPKQMVASARVDMLSLEKRLANIIRKG